MAGQKLPKNITDARAEKCYDLRYNSTDPFSQKDWIKYCHENYGDKSEIAYHQYWAQSSELYKAYWREKLDKQVGPAVDKIIELLDNEDPRISQKAIEQIFKYTGNDIEKVDMNIEGNITINWGI